MHSKRSKVHGLAVLLALLGVFGLFCRQTSGGSDQSKASPASSSNAVSPDNSGVNVRDRDRGAVTPFTQSNNRSDVELTRQVRRALMQDKSLSTTARNIKVITVGGNVTLRGPVKSEHEKAVIAHKVLQIAGTGHINNQLEIAGR